MIRPGWRCSLLAIFSAAATTAFVVATATEFRLGVTQLAIFGFVIHLVGLLVGSVPIVGAASAPLLGAGLISVVADDDPIWIRSAIIGCLVYVTVELGWEAIARREPAEYARSAIARRLQESLTVVVTTLVLVLVASIAAGYAPVRTLPVQLLVVGGFLAAFVMVARRLAEDQRP